MQYYALHACVFIQIYLFLQDKTFGLKNKKGAKQQRFIQQVQHQVKSGGVSTKKTEDLKKLEKEKKLKDQKEMNLLFKPVATQKVEKGKVLIISTNIFCCYLLVSLCNVASWSKSPYRNYRNKMIIFFMINNMDNGKEVGVMLPFLDLYLGGTWFKIKVYLLS